MWHTESELTAQVAASTVHIRPCLDSSGQEHRLIHRLKRHGGRGRAVLYCSVLYSTVLYCTFQSGSIGGILVRPGACILDALTREPVLEGRGGGTRMGRHGKARNVSSQWSHSVSSGGGAPRMHHHGLCQPLAHPSMGTLSSQVPLAGIKEGLGLRVGADGPVGAGRPGGNLRGPLPRETLGHGEHKVCGLVAMVLPHSVLDDLCVPHLHPTTTLTTPHRLTALSCPTLAVHRTCSC